MEWCGGGPGKSQKSQFQDLGLEKAKKPISGLGGGLEKVSFQTLKKSIKRKKSNFSISKYIPCALKPSPSPPVRPQHLQPQPQAQQVQATPPQPPARATSPQPSPAQQTKCSPAQPPSRPANPNTDSKKKLSVKTFGQNVIGTQTLNNFYKPCPHSPSQPQPPFRSKLLETCPKRFSQKDSLKKFLSSVKRGPAPPHPNSKCGSKRGNLPKTFLSKLIGTQTLNNFYKP